MEKHAWIVRHQRAGDAGDWKSVAAALGEKAVAGLKKRFTGDEEKEVGKFDVREIIGTKMP